MSRSRSLLAALVAACAGTDAQTLPAQGTEAVPRYVSALRDYRSFTDERLASWRDANDTVRRIGGWRAYGREAFEALRKPAPQPPDRRDPLDARHEHGGAR